MTQISPHPLSDFFIRKQPFYLARDNEEEIGLAAVEEKLPLLLKGPTGCGKTRFMQALAWKIGRPLITVACHDDLSAADLTGRFLIKDGQTVWQDGPLTLAVKYGGICYLDEIVEARKDTVVVIHPLTDDRRVLAVEKLAELYTAADDFLLTVSYNPGYQSVLKELKVSTRQRFVSLQFDYPEPEAEAEIVMREAGVDESLAKRLVRLAGMTRELRESGLAEGSSTRLVIQTGRLIRAGIPAADACRAGMMDSLTDDPALLIPLYELVSSLF